MDTDTVAGKTVIAKTPRQLVENIVPKDNIYFHEKSTIQAITFYEML